MSVQDLFDANDAYVGETFSRQTVTRIAPNRSETPLTGVIFHDTTEQELQITTAGKSASRIGVLDNVSAAQEIHPDDEYLINGQRWKYRGPGGVQGAYQSVLIRLPQKVTHAMAGK